MSGTVITREVQLDMGHRVPDHQSKCRNPHGHRYRVVLAVTGPVIDEQGNPEDGMVMDFGRLAEALAVVVHDPFDHGFCVASSDLAMREALDSLYHEDWVAKVITIDGPPTAERLAALWGERLAAYLAPAGIAVAGVTVWETPNCSATWTP